MCTRWVHNAVHNAMAFKRNLSELHRCWVLPLPPWSAATSGLQIELKFLVASREPAPYAEHANIYWSVLI